MKIPDLLVCDTVWSGRGSRTPQTNLLSPVHYNCGREYIEEQKSVGIFLLAATPPPTLSTVRLNPNVEKRNVMGVKTAGM